MPRDTLVMILAGGRGARLHALTLYRAKPAVPFGGKYRIIDVVLSNFVNSGFTKIKVLTQYKSESLDKHLSRGWRLSPILDQFVESVPAQQRLGPRWYEGNADAIHQNLNLVEDERPDHVCVFGGDHIYKMDVGQMLSYHRQRGADLTVAAVPVPIEQASSFGVIEIDEDWRMIGFQEKPAEPRPMPGRSEMVLASMGNYVFRSEALTEVVKQDAGIDSSKHDLGGDIVTGMFRDRPVYVYDFCRNRVPGQTEAEVGYWRDIGTIDAYMEAQMDLISVSPVFDLYNWKWPVRTTPQNYAPAKFVHEAGERVGTATNSIVSDGCVISGGRIRSSVLSPCVRVNSYSHIDGSILMEGVDVGRYARLRRCIIDKDVKVPQGMQIGYDREFDEANFFVSEGGVTVIHKGMDLSVLKG